MTLLDLVAQEKQRQAAKVRRQRARLPNKYNGNPVPPELPPGIPAEECPEVPVPVGRWRRAKDWTVAELRGLRMVFKRCETEDEFLPSCAQMLQNIDCPAAVALPQWQDADVNLSFDLSSLGGSVPNLDFAKTLAFVSSFPADPPRSLHLWSLLLTHLRLGPPTWNALPLPPSLVVEFDLAFSFVAQPHAAYAREGAVRVTAHGAEARVWPVGFAAHAKQKGYCEVAAHLLACAHEVHFARQRRQNSGGEEDLSDITVFSFLLHHTSVKAWKATFPVAYLTALRQGGGSRELPCEVALLSTPSLHLNRSLHRVRAAALVLAVFASAGEM